MPDVLTDAPQQPYQGPDVPLACGFSWYDILKGREPSDGAVLQLMDFLGAAKPDHLVHTSWPAGVRTALQNRVTERLVIVGSDGAGRYLRRDSVSMTTHELLDCLDAIYLCEVREQPRLRFALIDVRPADEKYRNAPAIMIIAPREYFAELCATLGADGTRGTVWRAGNPASPSILSMDEEDYVFSHALVSKLLDDSVRFLTGAGADRMRQFGVIAKRGIILHGAPGNGKTALVRLCARRALVAGLSVSLIEEKKKSLFLPDRSLRDDLALAAARGPALIIIEDIDLLCGTREPELVVNVGSVTGDGDRGRNLHDLIDFLDGMEPTAGYVLMATTNALDSLDPALRRTGRLDVSHHLSFPAAAVREQVLVTVCRKGPAPAPDFELAVSLLEGGSFSDVAEVGRRYLMRLALDETLGHQETMDEVVTQFVNERASDLADSRHEIARQPEP